MPRLHITGASGSGTTTLGAALAEALRSRHLDTDDFFWESSDPPYQQARLPRARLDLLQQAFAAADQDWVLSGSLNGWGDPLIPAFELVIFLTVPTDMRLARLRARELGRFGAAALAPGGAMHESHVEFLDWASRYDSGERASRNLERHLAWLERLPCRCLKLDGRQPVGELTAMVTAALAETVSRHPPASANENGGIDDPAVPLSRPPEFKSMRYNRQEGWSR